MPPEDVLDFWFDESSSRHWFRSTPAFDAQIRKRFEVIWHEAVAGDLSDWEDSSAGALALVIVLDQFPLNMFRDKPESFASEAQSREVAKRAIARNFDNELEDHQKPFLYLPFMHSEDLTDQDRSVELFKSAGLVDNLRWAQHHRDVVRRFGRFPHRNAILGRNSSPQEQAWLNSPEGFNP